MPSMHPVLELDVAFTAFGRLTCLCSVCYCHCVIMAELYSTCGVYIWVQPYNAVALFRYKWGYLPSLEIHTKYHPLFLAPYIDACLLIPIRPLLLS